MDKNEKNILEQHSKLMILIFKSLLYTLLVIIFSFYGVSTLLGYIFSNSIIDIVIVSLIIGCIFTVILCTLTVLDKYKSSNI